MNTEIMIAVIWCWLYMGMGVGVLSLGLVIWALLHEHNKDKK